MPHICFGRKADQTRCTAPAKFFDNTLCGTHNNQRRYAGPAWVLPVWNDNNAPAPPPAPAITTCQRCERVLAMYRQERNLLFCAPCEVTRDRPDLPVEERCHWNVAHPRARVCMRKCATGSTLCKKHHDVERKAIARAEYIRARRSVNDAPVWQDAVEEIETNFAAWPLFGVIGSWDRNSVLAQIALDLQIPELYNRVQEMMGRLGRMDEAGEIFMINYRVRHALPRANLGELEAFATDAQNVHTRATTTTTEKGLRILLADPVVNPVGAIHILLKVLETHPQMNMNIAHDVFKWNETSECRAKGDFLYKKTLDALWVRIQASEHKEELTKRLREEFADSVGMCCDGHISRLVNVLVGFDPEFLPPVSAGELLQQRMSALAGLDIETEEKVIRANAIFDELGMPAEERGAWIEAF